MKQFFTRISAPLMVFMFLTSQSVFSQSGIFESYAILNLNGGGNTYYDLNASTGNPDFEGAVLGTFSLGESIVIAGGENKTYKCNPCNILNGVINYRVYLTGSPSGSFTSVNLPWDSNLGTGCDNNDQKWQNTTNPTNILSGLPVGNYTLEIYSHADYDGCGTGTVYASNGGLNYKATFSVICPTITVSETHIDPTCAGGASNGSIDISVSGGTPLSSITTQTYTQDFNTLSEVGSSNTWTNNSTLANWYSNRTVYIASAGTSTTGGLYSFGNSSDRGLGSLGSSSANPITYGVSITNTTGLLVTSLDVVYTGEQWRCGGSTSVVNTLDFAYQLNAASISSGTWTDYNSLDFIGPIVSCGSASSLDGNAAANRITYSQTISVNINPGETIWLRWNDPDNSSSDHGLAVDDLSVTLNAPSSYYLYSWSNGASTEDLSGLSEDTYSVTVTDANGCTGLNSIVLNLPDELTFYTDSDGDTYGDAASTALACSAPSGYVSDDTDCDDADATIHPGATEVCNGIDEDCDGTIDNGVELTFYADSDGDTYGDAASTALACSAPSGYVSDDTDCDDADATIHPGATEVCNGIDEDCDGTIDEETVSASITPAIGIAICRGTSIPLTANTGIDYEYQWYKNGHLIPGATSSVFEAIKPAYYSVQVTIPGGCNATSAVTAVSILQSPNANIFTPEGLDLCFDPSLKLKASSKAGYSWQWYKDGSPILGETNAIYFATSIGTYYCEITSSSGCSKTSPNAIVSASCKMDVEMESSFELYPNPTSGNVTIQLLNNEETKEIQIAIMNLYGEIVYESQFEAQNGLNNFTINLDESISAGMYLIQLKDKYGAMNKQIEIIK